jgi:hypothetical protein
MLIFEFVGNIKIYVSNFDGINLSHMGTKKMILSLI